MNILKDGDSHYIINDANILNKLDNKNYILTFDKSGCFLLETQNFTFPDKIYDVDDKLINFVTKDFNSSAENLGVLFVGSKGQGKTLSAKIIGDKLNIPVIIVKDKIPSHIDFIGFLGKIEQDFILFVDEFEKLFNEYADINGDNDYHSQNVFLSFMDGSITKQNKILFLLTSNSEVNRYLINRPSRIKYVKEYDELDVSIVDMIIDDKLTNKNYKKDLLDNISLININIDLLISIIENINKFDLPFSQFSEFFNYKTENYRYEIFIIDKKGKKEFNRIYQDYRKPGINDSNIFGFSVIEVIKIDKDTVMFKTDKDRIIEANRMHFNGSDRDKYKYLI